MMVLRLFSNNMQQQKVDICCGRECVNANIMLIKNNYMGEFINLIENTVRGLIIDEVRERSIYR